jgi:membrane protease YdiL (CAAX protease family)
MTRYDHFIRLLVLAGFMTAGLLLTAMVSAVVMLLGGMSLEDLMVMGQTGTMDFTPGMTRVLLISQHLLTFILPGLVFGLLFYKSSFLKGFDLSVQPTWILIILGIFFLMAAYPLVNLSYLINEAIPLPSWAYTFEDQAADTLKAILDMPNVLILILNIIIIGILPGIGEELIFRGIVQKQTGLMFKSPIAGIWISAFIFSAIHFQFEGFLPRMALGAVLGYLYYWTGNLWVPIIAHTFNNGIQVILIYATGGDISTFDDTSSEQLEWWMIPLSIGIMYLLYTAILKNRRISEPV